MLQVLCELLSRARSVGAQVVATDISATYPAAADALPEVGYQRALSAEPIRG